MKLFSVLVTFSILIILSACANKTFKDQFEEEKTWTERATQLPPYPDMNNLLEFDATGQAVTGNQYLIDPASISVGEDGVIRFSLIIKSSSGALNVSYEGIRCETTERKLYALGRNDKTWAEPRVSEWEKLINVRQLYAQRELARNIFCPNRQIVRNKEDAIQALKTGYHPSMPR
ncbi:CNP1-like family protein [Nitrosomonas sp. PY1]|uniref:CNP1-like family protein n=1 Tax=Nitrosomonas sp. PY1 TaxID=1803906 RepID=UPI001FC7E6F5|nr:CNP1-like family protein [Nitrosomonas sp. PY1]GKS69089.1 CNP1-like family protein [Nitrosomonas sp. PY1]